ncbi:MAG TPA: glycosyltransferase family 4 protein [Candidatus Paceibacterota bacterium]|nr:glycosyltransferase family 4 protein [Candidatus Paceibacterota bacterium]
MTTNAKKQKTLYIITKSNFGGAQRYVYELATGLPRDRFEPVVAAGGDGILFEKLRAAGVRTVTIASFERDISITKELRSMFELARIIRRERPDVVHLNSSKAGGSGAFVARLLGVRQIIFTAHGWPFYEDRGALWRAVVWFFSWLTALLSHRVIVVSARDRAVVLPFSREKLTLIHTAVPHIDFLDRADARGRLFSAGVVSEHEHDLWLVTNAELTKNKNLFTALDAVSRYNEVRDTKIFYTLISDGELRHELEMYVRDRGLSHAVRFTGYLDDARTYLRAFDVFLLPSLKEGMPYALLEAGAAGLPSIASDVGGIPEVIENGATGLLIDPRNTDTIVTALETYARSMEKRDACGNALKEKVAREFDIARMLERTFALYGD